METKAKMSAKEKLLNQEQRKLLDEYRDQIYRKIICENRFVINHLYQLIIHLFLKFLT